MIISYGYSVKLKRRDFLKSFTTLPILSCGSYFNPSSPLKKKDKILIVGAGLAGLSCARILTTEGYDVEILEGRERVGGRAFSLEVGGVEGVDLGASYLHGGPENPLRRFFDHQEFSFVNHADVEIFISPTQQIDLYQYKDYWTEVDMKLEEVASFPYLVAYLRSLLSLPLPVSTVQEMITQVWSKLENHPLKTVAGEDFLSELSNQFFGVESSQLSLANLLIEPEVDISGHGPFPAGEVLSRSGVRPMVETLAKNLTIQYSTKVQRIQKADQSFLLTVEKSDLVSEMRADHLVMAVPLACYKENLIQLEFPMIRQWTEAFQGLEVSHLNKIVLKFKDAFWSKNSQSLFFKAQDKTGGVFYQNLLYHRELPILISFKSGADAKLCDMQTDEQLIAKELELLKSFFPEANIDLVTAKVTRWGKDEFSRGAFSHLGMGAFGTEHNAFQKYLMDKFWIAGEFAHPTDAGTMHGAYLSGQWVARKMLAQVAGGE